MRRDRLQTRFGAAEEAIKSWTTMGSRIGVLILVGIASWRLAWSEVSLDMAAFDFSALLALILALFAMAMSVAFYFKSTDSSNQFYDNIYNFTQKTSEILGRIEERFGERLGHLGEEYGRIESRLEYMSRGTGAMQQELEDAEGEEEEVKKRLADAQRRTQELLEELTAKAQMEDREKQAFYKEMAELEAERNHSNANVEFPVLWAGPMDWLRRSRMGW